MSWSGRRVARWRPIVVLTWGNTCILCHEPIDLALAHPHPRSLSIEHLRPRSRGGADTIDNLRPAHLTCNVARGNRPLESLAGRRPTRRGRFSPAAPTPAVPPLPVSPRTPRKNPETDRNA